MASDEDPMSGRAVLVTGAARGIGRAVAEAFAEQGERVAVHHGHSAALADEVLARADSRQVDEDGKRRGRQGR